MELKIPATAAGMCTLRAGKFSVTGEFITREEATTFNSFTDYGFSQIGVQSLGLGSQTADLSSSYAHLGEGTLSSPPSSPAALNDHKLTSDVMTKSTSVQAAKFETEGVYDSVLPWVRTTTCTITIAPQSVNRIYTEVGLGKSSATGDYLYTYALFRDSNGDPSGVTVLADEYITLTYVYQISMNWALPQGIDVTGTGIPAGTKAYLLRKYSSVQQGVFYYTGGYAASGWEGIDHKDMVVKADTLVNSQSSQAGPTAGLKHSGWMGSSNPEVNALSSLPSGNNTFSSSPGGMNGTSDTWMVVGAGTSAAGSTYFVFFNKGIPLTKDDAFNFSATLTLSPNWSNGTFMEDPDGDRVPVGV